MFFKNENQLDDIDLQIINELKRDARLSFSEIGRRVSLSQPTVAERVRRLEESGVIRGYHADIDPCKIGRPVTAFIRLKIAHPSPGQYKFEKLLETDPAFAGIVESHRITGDDCLLIKAYVSSIGSLNDLLGRLNVYGDPNTSIVLSTTTERLVPIPQLSSA